MKNTTKHLERSLFKRIRNALLAFFMVLTLLPVMGDETVEAVAFSIDNLTIEGDNYNVVLPKGYSANLMGTIKSSYTIYNVYAQINNRWGEPVYKKLIDTDSKSINLKETAINKSVNGSTDYIRFGNMASGKYTLYIKAWSVGHVPITKSLEFTISDENTPVTIRRLSIDGKRSSNITLQKGKSANLNGIVFAGRKVSSINLVVKKSNGSKVYDQTIYPDTTYVNLKECALNKAVNGQKIYLKFGSLDAGTYTLTVTAKGAFYHETASESLTFTIK
ncbi:MAG: hypothetical protein IKX10_09035 [Lachnospiraceae bacterium]|nr:hypothetical protein [Lachnospiraceae bacterium]